MDMQTIILVLTVFFIASFLKGLTGLGFSTLCLGFLAVFIDLKLAIPLVFLPSLTSNLIIMIQTGRFIEGLKRFWLLYISALPGLVIGIWFLGSSQNQAPAVLLGIVMFLYGFWGLKQGLIQLSEKKEKQLAMPVGIISGLVNGATGSQIMPIMPYLLSIKMDRDLFIQSINCAFTFNTIVMMIGLGKLGLITQSVVYLSAGGILPVALGIFLGGKIRKRVSDDLYRKMVLSLLIALGISLIFKSLL